MSTSAVSREISRSSLSVVAALQERYYAPRAMGTKPDTYTLPLYFLTPRSSIHISQNVSLKFRFSFPPPPPVPIWVQVSGFSTSVRSYPVADGWQAPPADTASLNSGKGEGPSFQIPPRCAAWAAVSAATREVRSIGEARLRIPGLRGLLGPPRSTPVADPAASAPRTPARWAFRLSQEPPQTGTANVSPDDLDPLGLCPRGSSLMRGVVQVNKTTFNASWRGGEERLEKDCQNKTFGR